MDTSCDEGSGCCDHRLHHSLISRMEQRIPSILHGRLSIGDLQSMGTMLAAVRKAIDESRALA
ncbi:MAG: hypothetical protein V1926_00070 [Candidatus Peregrinibacteria bacterium]